MEAWTVFSEKIRRLTDGTDHIHCLRSFLGAFGWRNAVIGLVKRRPDQIAHARVDDIKGLFTALLHVDHPWVRRAPPNCRKYSVPGSKTKCGVQAFDHRNNHQEAYWGRVWAVSRHGSRCRIHRPN